MVGHGLSAATVMGQLRSALSAASRPRARRWPARSSTGTPTTSRTASPVTCRRPCCGATAPWSSS
ncbi:hypothetical protein [Streptomyces sp. NPDC004728]|uniref:hypothetical protein n=1 Tax=Streptomyces sp. NPDC004728 TaxID=3154289 RepID=UPI0033B94A41